MNPSSSNLMSLLGGVALSVPQVEEELDRLRESEESLRQLLQTMVLQLDQMRSVAAEESRRAEQCWQLLLDVADRCFGRTDPALQPLGDHLAAGFQRLGYTLYGTCGERVTDWSAYEIVGKTSSLPGDGPIGAPVSIFAQREAAKNVSEISWVVVQVLKIGLRNTEGAMVRRAKVVIGPDPTLPQFSEGEFRWA